MLKFKLPFWLWPYSWGMKGRTRDIAQAEYELSGNELRYRLLEINRDDYTEEEYQKRVADLDYQTGKITESEYKRFLISLIKDETRRNLSLVELEFQEKKITEIEFYKQSATIRKEPWVTVLNMDFNQKDPQEGSFELDWNEYFVSHLKERGYKGKTDDQVVNQWFIELCANVANETFANAENLEADPAANLETFSRWSSNTTKEKVDDKRKGYR